jgi:exodeoxyribonuclease VII large subunit
MEKIPSVTTIVSQIKNILEGEFRALSVEGEVTNLSASSSGHWYFSLSDKQSSISVALFKMDALRNPFVKKLRNGDQIICSGSIGVYTKKGTFQLIAKRLAPAGKGDLNAQFEKLKLKLGGEGLFDLEHKIPIPSLPKKIGVVTAKSSAALQDFLKIMNRRCHWYDILIADALVQGEKAPSSIRQALFNLIKYSLDADDEHKLDVIVLTRGGGSMEDLWAFNDEALAWDIYNSPIPIISAIGHEVDYTICDMVSDLRLETPSAGAENLSNKQTEIFESLEYSRKTISRIMKDKMNEKHLALAEYHPQRLIEIFYEKINFYRKKLNNLNPENKAIQLLKIFEKSMRLDELFRVISQSVEDKVQNLKTRNNKSGELLRVLDPSNILGRGYTLLKDINGKVLSNKASFSKIKKDSDLKIVFNDGEGIVLKNE